MCQDLADDRPECPFGESCYRYGNPVGLVVLPVLLNFVTYSFMPAVSHLKPLTFSFKLP